MTVTATAKRRRKQAKMGYTHMSPMDRPHYAHRDTETMNRREARAAERRKMIATRGGKVKG